MCRAVPERRQSPLHHRRWDPVYRSALRSLLEHCRALLLLAANRRTDAQTEVTRATTKSLEAYKISVHLSFVRMMTMRVFLVSLTPAVIIALGASVVLDPFQNPASVPFSTPPSP